MLFHSLQFAIFFLIVYSLYLFLPHKWQNRMLLVASYVFYGSWDWRYLSLLMISTVVDFLCAINLEKTEDPAKRKKFVAISVFVNLSMLGVFKYYDFFAVSFQEMAASMGLRVDPTTAVAVGSQPAGAGSQFFNGRIDDVRILQDALNAAEISNIALPVPAPAAPNGGGRPGNARR